MMPVFKSAEFDGCCRNVYREQRELNRAERLALLSRGHLSELEFLVCGAEHINDCNDEWLHRLDIAHERGGIPKNVSNFAHSFVAWSLQKNRLEALRERLAATQSLVRSLLLLQLRPRL